jgi:hypothetical protein
VIDVFHDQPVRVTKARFTPYGRFLDAFELLGAGFVERDDGRLQQRDLNRKTGRLKGLPVFGRAGDD